MAVIGPIPNNAVDEQDAKGKILNVSRGWREWLSQAYNILAALTQSGTTAQRPDTIRWIGRTYFDATLGIPIWWDGSQWVDATGAPA